MRWDNRRSIRPGERVRLELPYSEVCTHIRVAGRVMDVRLTENRYPAAQLLNSDGSEFSFPITTGEAGIYGSLEAGFHCYPESGPTDQPSGGSTERLDEAVDRLGGDEL